MAKIKKDRIDAMSMDIKGTIRQALSAIDRGALGLALLIEPESNRFEGLVTDGDIRRALLSGMGLETPVASVPRPKSKTALQGMSLGEVSSLFSEPVRIVPLLDEYGRVADLAILDQRVHLPVAEPSLGETELMNVSECILTGWISSSGKFVSQFEEKFAELCGARYAVATNNGTSALHLALLALDIGPGDEVIVPTLTFIATANAVTYTGARPVFVDSERETWNIDPARIEDALSPRTKAIIPVHLYGHPANMDPILEIASRRNLAVVEDAAEAHMALYKNRTVGSLGNLGCFSFYGNKVVTTGEGGMILTNNKKYEEKIRMLRDHGMSRDKKYWHPMIGFNYRLTNIQAAIGVAQLDKLDRILKRKREIAKLYNSAFSGVNGIIRPPETPWAKNIYWMYTILIEDGDGRNRDELIVKLKQQGIETRPMFYPIHTMPPYFQDKRFPIAEDLSKKGISLPSSPNLKDDEIERVSERIRSLIK